MRVPHGDLTSPHGVRFNPAHIRDNRLILADLEHAASGRGRPCNPISRFTTIMVNWRAVGLRQWNEQCRFPFSHRALRGHAG